MSPQLESTTLTAVDRSTIYEMLSSVYLKQPGKADIAAAIIFLGELQEIFPTTEGEQLYTFLTDRYEKLLAGNTELLNQLRQEYYDHFFVPSSGFYVPPFESAVMSNTLWGHETTHCAACYNEVNFNPLNLTLFPPYKDISIPDHIGFQLAFMAYLAKHESIGGEEKTPLWRQLQLHFASEHLSWLEHYSELLAKCGSPFYTALAQLTAKYVTADLSLLEQDQQRRGDLN